MRSLGLSLVLVCFGACSAKHVAVGGACAKTADCTAGAFCRAGACSTHQCDANADCGADICNASFVCAPSTGSPLAITAVHGDTADAASPEGYVVGNGGIVISGTGFDATVKVFLVDAVNTVTALTSVSVANAETMTAALPTLIDTAVTSSTAATRYAVRVSTAAGGTVTRDVSILRGAQGPAGDPVSVAAGPGITVSGSPALGFTVGALLYGVAGTVVTLTGNEGFAAAGCGATGRIVTGFCVTNPPSVTALSGPGVSTGGTAPGLWKYGAFASGGLDTPQTAANPTLDSLWLCDIRGDAGTSYVGYTVQAYAVCMNAP